MLNIIFATKVRLLGLLPVVIIRKWLHKPVCIRSKPKLVTGDKQLLIDVSVIITNDARTGIQRVVRALLLQLLRNPPVGYQVRPIFATRKHGYRYAPNHFGLLDGKKSDLADTVVVKVKSGDLYLGLDLAAHLLPANKSELAHWKRQGVLIHVIVYDLLPVLHPHWFNAKTTRNFHRWLKVIASLADSVICISNTVKAEFEGWLSHQYELSVGTIPVHTISLGADLQSSIPSCGLPDDIEQLLNKFSNQTTVLMVGTVEPRKGHDQVLLAFDELWKQGCDVNLIIVGKPGWKTDFLQQKLRSHPQLNSHLHWFDKASDEFLELLYRSCSGVIVASYAEGYGLPLIEAMYHNKPVLARDIPVFREIGGSFASFFPDTTFENLIALLLFWLDKIEQHQMTYNAYQYSWQDSACELLACLKLGKSATVRTVNCDYTSHDREAML